MNSAATGTQAKTERTLMIASSSASIASSGLLGWKVLGEGALGADGEVFELLDDVLVEVGLSLRECGEWTHVQGGGKLLEREEE
jgi:hypothetical protein